jgi:pyruvate dehydrogenase E1 component beta subunit
MTRVVSYREALGEALREALAADERVLVLGQDVGARGGAYGVTAGLLEAFGPDRVRDAPGAEAALVGVAIGAAMAGLRPVAELTTATFAALAFDQVVHHAAPLRTLSGGRLRAPLVLRMPQTTGSRLGPVHSTNVEALLHHIPGLTVLAPATPADAKAMLAWAIGEGDDPVVVLEHVALYDTRGEVDDPRAGEPFGAAVRRAGDDVTITATSRMVAVALAAAETLAAEHGIAAEVLDLRALRPLDTPAVLASVARTGRAVLVEEGWPAGGVTATLAAAIGQAAPAVRVTGADTHVPYARTLERAALPDVAAIVRAVLERAPGAAAATSPPTTPSTLPQTHAAELDMEALASARRATGTPLADLVAARAAPLLSALGSAAIITADGDVRLLNAAADAAPHRPATSLQLGPTTTRPTTHAGAVTIHHLAPLTLRTTTAPDATALLERLVAVLSEPA